ncbi:hypothetical protein [Mobilicoccus caccae]|uniref:Uncharacterized protein n=1 Tax=Mobilicoccus caccae TaxID=1859295 RepID=A0ABQ6IL51_9MICO|nr:hypothetical protein [Mobilicoccus caccae]GMA38620.1 hypothetical protein GCM10025883_06650 [Mobilicoccus caccae]
MDLGLTWLGIASLLATLAIAFYVHRLQRKDSESWAEVDGEWKRESTAIFNELREVVRELAEQNAVAQEVRIEADSEPEPGQEPPNSASPSAPAGLSEYVKGLRAENVQLNFDNLRWTKKIRCDGEQRGNLGWFVGDDGENRYFIHRGRGLTVRPSIPRSLLDAWLQDTGREPCEIELDYRTGVGPGNHAWFVRTYDGTTWRVARGEKGRVA